MLPPIGYVKRATGEFAIDPDEQVQAVVRLVFDALDQQGTVCGVLRYLVRQGISHLSASSPQRTVSRRRFGLKSRPRSEAGDCSHLLSALDWATLWFPVRRHRVACFRHIDRCAEQVKPQLHTCLYACHPRLVNGHG